MLADRPTSHPPPGPQGGTQPAVSTRISALDQSAACIWPFSIPLKKGLCRKAAPGRESLFSRAPRTSFPLSPLPDTRSTRMTVTAQSAQRPPDCTHGRPGRSSGPQAQPAHGSPGRRPASGPQGRVLTVPSARSRLVGPGEA